MRFAVVFLLVLLVSGCSSGEKESSDSSAVKSTEEKSDSDQARQLLEKGKNFPQVELAKRKDVLKLTGTIEVPGYERGRIQVDAYYPDRMKEGNSPLTTATFEKPGPFELLLPPEVDEVSLIAILDFESDGPNASDATAEYEENPISVHEKSAAIDFVIDKSNTKAPPPKGTAGNTLPPWEKADAPEGAGDGAVKTGDSMHKEAPPGSPGGATHEEAPPGAPGGPPEPLDQPKE